MRTTNKEECKMPKKETVKNTEYEMKTQSQYEKPKE